MASLNEQSFERKLQNVNTTQDSIQTLSLWCIHHKSQHKKIVNLWMKVLKKSKSAHRLCLFYLCNDVVQNSRRRGAPIFLETFKDVLEEAASLARDPAIRPNILRIFTIWEERSVFDSEFVEKLHASVVSSKVRMQKVSTRFLADFRPQTVTEGIEKFHRMESELELKQKQLTNLKVDVTDTEALRQLKDRNDGKRFSQNFEDGAIKLEEYVRSLETEIAERHKLIEILEQSEIFYEAQFSEAKIVSNAYKNFGTRVSNLKRRLDELKKFLPDPSSPIPSPTIDAPSPGATPPTPPYDPSLDNFGMEDMDMSDSDDDKPVAKIIAAEPIKPTASAARTLTKPRPSAADTKPVSKTGYGPIPTVTGVTFSSFMSGGLPSTVLPTSAESTPVHTMSTVQASNIVAYSPSSNTSAPSPVGSPVDLLLSPKPNTKTNPIVPAAGSNVNTVDSKNYSSSLSLGSGMLDLDSRLQQVMQNAPSLPQSLFHSPTRSGQSPSISTPPSQRTMIQTQSWGDSPISVTRHLPALSSPATSTSGGLTPSQILGLVQANTQQPGKTEPGKTTPSGTPLRDEGGTPVQDEDTKVPSQSNPIDFLSQLITSTRNAQGGNTSSNFLSGLAALTETMKSAMRKQQLGGSKSNWPETEGGFPPLGLDPNNPLSESIASIATHSLTSTAASIMTSASTHVLTTPPTNILTSQPPQTLKSPASMYTQAVPTSFPPPVVSPVQLFSPTSMFPEPISAMQTPLGQMPVVVSTVLTSTSTASTAASIDSITQNPVASDHHSGMENSHDVQSIIPVSSINQSVSAAVSMSENITTNYPTTAQHESFDTLAVSVSQPSTEEQPEPQIETMENSIPVVEPTSPIPVLGGSRGGFAAPAEQPTDAVGLEASSQIKIQETSLGGGDTNSTLSADTEGNPIPSYSVSAVPSLTSVYGTPQMSSSLGKQDYGQSNQIQPASFSAQSFTPVQPIERLDRTYDNRQSINVVQQNALDPTEYARLYGRSFNQNSNFPQRDYDPYRRGAAISTLDRSRQYSASWRGDSRYARHDPYYDFDYRYHPQGGPRRMRPYRY